MKEYVPVLKCTKMFANIEEKDILAMLSCLQARKKTFKKGEYVFRQGDQMNDLIVLAEGSLHIQREDYWGNRSIINIVRQGELFGEAYVGQHTDTLLNDAVAVEDCTILLFDVFRILHVCSSACQFHTMVVQNLFLAISEKNRQLVRKLGHMSKRTTRDKLMSYLSEEAKKQKSGIITIPFNRQQLADFLSVDRSAMSNELCKMRDDGLITFEKNRFELFTEHEEAYR